MTPPLRRFARLDYATASPFLSQLLFERLGGVIAYVCARLGVPPAAVTVLSGATGIAGALVLASASDASGVLAAGLLLVLSYCLDCADGQLARATGMTSARGAWLDVAVDSIVIAFLTASLSSILPTDGRASIVGVVLAGGYGAARMLNLWTASVVRDDGGGFRLTGAPAALRAAYVAVIDTPVAYVLLCATRLDDLWFAVAVATLALMTLTQALVSAQHHFATPLVGPRADAPVPTHEGDVGTKPPYQRAREDATRDQ